MKVLWCIRKANNYNGWPLVVNARKSFSAVGVSHAVMATPVFSSTEAWFYAVVLPGDLQWYWLLPVDDLVDLEKVKEFVRPFNEREMVACSVL